VGLKEATAAASRAREILSQCPQEFILLSAMTPRPWIFMAVGARGVISVTANVAPRRMHEACAAALSGDMARAGRSMRVLQPCIKIYFIEASPIPVKWAVARMGLMGNTLRLPLVPTLHPRMKTPVLRAMHAAGITLEDQAA